MPTIIRWTGHVEPNSVNTKLLSSLDWFPTFSFLAGFKLSSSVVYDGVDISAALFSDAPSPRRVFYYHSTDETLLDQSNDTNGSVTPADKSRPNMPLLMAVRKDQYKLHLYTRGAHALRPAVGRSDWRYPDWACEEPLRNHTRAPVLFDLHKDPGETVPRTPCPGWDGKWPISGKGNGAVPGNWHSGCMTEADYTATVAELVELYDRRVASFPRVVSEIWKGARPDRFPCCNPGCSPMPDCCHCGSAPRAALAGALGL